MDRFLVLKYSTAVSLLRPSLLFIDCGGQLDFFFYFLSTRSFVASRMMMRIISESGEEKEEAERTEAKNFLYMSTTAGRRVREGGKPDVRKDKKKKKRCYSFNEIRGLAHVFFFS